MLVLIPIGDLLKSQHCGENLNVPFNLLIKMRVISCIYEFEGKILLLRRVKDDKFGIIGGKSETADKEDLDVIVRECCQEIGIKTQKEKYEKVDKWSGNPVYRYSLGDSDVSKIRLNLNEHSEYLFVLPVQALKLDLSTGLTPIIKKYNKGK